MVIGVRRHVDDELCWRDGDDAAGANIAQVPIGHILGYGRGQRGHRNSPTARLPPKRTLDECLGVAERVCHLKLGNNFLASSVFLTPRQAESGKHFRDPPRNGLNEKAA